MATKDSEFVDGRIFSDPEHMRQLSDAARADGYVLTCGRCRDVLEPVVAVISIPLLQQAYSFCGKCYREISTEFLGHVV